MRVRSSLPESFFEQGFTEHTDPFGHKDLADRLTHLFGNLEHGTVSILDGRWGTGKTVFAKQWVGHLRSEGVPSIYFDAFAVDYIDDPFQAVSSAFIKAAADARQTDTTTYERFISSAARAGKAIGSTAAKISTKVLTLGVIGAAEIESLGDLKDELSSSAGELSEAAVKNLLEAQASSEAAFEELRKSLSELPDLLAPVAETQEGDEPAPARSLVVVIDELDRCRPDFALGVLESLKHFFRADRVHFVLVTTRHLRLSVQKRYGVGEAAQEYLQKFYDFIIHFEATNADHRGPNSAIMARRLLQEILPSHVQGGERHELAEMLAKIATAFDLTLRQTEAVVTNVTLAYLAVRDREFRPRVLICFLALLKALRPEMYQKVKIRRLDYEEFRSFIASANWPDDFNNSYVLDMFRYHGDPTLDPADPEFEGYGRGLYQYNFRDRLDILPYLANGVMDRFGKV